MVWEPLEEKLLVGSLGVSPALAGELASEVMVLMIVMVVLLVLVAAWESLGNVIDHLAYIVSIGLTFSHLIRHMDTYDAMYLSLGGKGSLGAEVMIAMLYIALPIGVAIMPVVGLPFNVMARQIRERRWSL